MDNQSVKIRAVTLDDAKAVATIHYLSWAQAYKDLLPEAYILQNNHLPERMTLWEKVIMHPKPKTWVAQSVAPNLNSSSSSKLNNEKPIIGFVSYYLGKECYEMTTLYLLPEYQGVGIGSKLITQAFNDMIRKNESNKVSLWVLQSNHAAIEFYKKHGFEVSGNQDIEHFDGFKIIDIEMIKIFYN